MAAQPVQVDPTLYTTINNSVFGKVAATLEELGRSEVVNDFVDAKLSDYFSKLKGFVEMYRSDAWLEDRTTIEKGDNSFTWGMGEYDTGKLAINALGRTTTNVPEKVNSNALFSVDEVVRASKMTDKQFKMWVANKMKKPLQDIVDGIILRFLTEVLNKVDNVATQYVHPDGLPTLAANHSYASTTYTYDNIIKVGGLPTALTEDALDALNLYASTLKDSDGQLPLNVNFDTIIVSAGSANAKAAMQLAGVTGALANANAYVNVAGEGTQQIYPQIHGQINVYYGSYKVVTVKGMDPDLWLAVDSSKEAPIKLRIVEYPRHTDTIPQANGSRLELFFGFVDFWANMDPKYVAGSRG